MTFTRIELGLLQQLGIEKRAVQRFFFFNAWDTLTKITGMNQQDASVIISTFVYEKSLANHTFENGSSLQILEDKTAISLFVTTPMKLESVRTFLESHGMEIETEKIKSGTIPFCKVSLFHVD